MPEVRTRGVQSQSSSSKQASSGGICGIFKDSQGEDHHHEDAMAPLDKMKEHLIGEFQSCDQGGIAQQSYLINC